MARTSSQNATVSASAANVTEQGVTVGGTDAALVASNAGRVAVWISNTHASQDAYLSLGGTAQTGKGIFLPHQATIRISEYSGAIRAIATGASTVLTYSEV